MRILLSTILAAATLALPAMSVAAHADDSCKLLEVASLAMTTDGTGRVYVPMTLDGQTINLLVDTGGLASTLSQTTVDSLGLQPVRMDDMQGYAWIYGGEPVDHYVTVPHILFGGMPATNHIFWVASHGAIGPEEGGILGPSDIMKLYDVEFDFANGAFNMFMHHCAGRVVYWTRGDYARVKLDLDAGSGQIHVPVTLDGKGFYMAVDTGAEQSVASLEEVEDDFGLDEKSFQLLPGSNEKHHVYRYPFKTLSFQGITVDNPDIVLVPDDELHMPRGQGNLLGMNVLRQLHLYIAYGEHALYVTPASER